MGQKLISLSQLLKIYITMLSKPKSYCSITKQVLKAAKHAMIRSVFNQIEDHKNMAKKNMVSSHVS